MERINFSKVYDMLANQMAEIADNKTTGEDLDVEIKKAHAMTGLASNIINIGKLQLQAAKYLGKDEETERLFITEKIDKK